MRELDCKLTDLDPRWISASSDAQDMVIGISFDHPVLRESRIAVYFKPPIVPDYAKSKVREPEYPEGKYVWLRGDSETFDDFGLSPSAHDQASGWHGFISEGVCKTI